MTQNPAPRQSMSDPMDPARATALAATLGRSQPFSTGDVLPPFAHQIYFWDPQVPVALGRDGHPKTGDFIPDLGLPRRMWAAGRLAFHAPLLAGVSATRRSVVDSMAHKTGRSGPLGFVTLQHEIYQSDVLALTEWQDIVYRQDGTRPAAPQPAPTGETLAEERCFDSTALFRYSALTFNGHRIHYDAAYAREVEGYPGLVVHGPLLAHLLMDLAQSQLGMLRSFTYRATHPLFANESACFCWKDGALWVRGADGRLCMEATAQ